MPAAHKIELVRRLQAAGCREIEVTSFVSPKWVPQMADNAAGHGRHPAPAGCAPFGADAEHEGPGGRAGGAAGLLARRGGGVRRRQRGLQPAQHQLLDRREHRTLPPGGGGRARGRAEGARGDLLRPGLPLPGRGQRRRGRTRRGADEGDRRRPLRRRRHHRRRHAAQGAGGAGAGAQHYPLAEVSGHFHDTYGQALANIHACLELGIAPSTPASPASAAAPMPRAPPATSRPRTWSSCCTAWASPPGSTSTRWSTPAAGSAACSAGRRCRAPARRCWPSAAGGGRGMTRDSPKASSASPRALAERGHAHAPRWLRRRGAHLAGSRRCAGRGRRPDRQERDLPPQQRRRRGAGGDLGRPARRREARGGASPARSAAPTPSSSRSAPAFRSAAWRRWRTPARR